MKHFECSHTHVARILIQVFFLSLSLSLYVTLHSLSISSRNLNATEYNLIIIDSEPERIGEMAGSQDAIKLYLGLGKEGNTFFCRTEGKPDVQI